MAELLSTVEAYRAIVRAKYPERDDLLQIESLHQMRYAKQLGIKDPNPAHEVLDLLRTGVASRKIRLYGVLKNCLPADIDPIDARAGELSVFDGTLKIYESKDTLRTSRIYTSVHCYANDLPLPKGKGGRPPKLDKAAVSAEVGRLMDHHGEFSADDPDWNAQVRLIEALRKEFGEASDSTFEEYIKQPLTDWRARRKAPPET
jgi:hypothetical protein